MTPRAAAMAPEERRKAIVEAALAETGRPRRVSVLLDADGVPAGTMTASVNGVEWSRGELADLHFGWGALVAHAARSTRLRAGDVIGSGTVGTGCILELGLVHGRDRYPWLAPGDDVVLAVDGIGELAGRIA